jgi:probable rRNA maturation factor
MIRISIASPQETVSVERRRMRQAAQTVLEGEGVREAVISLAFVDNATIRRLNLRYLDQDAPTDVLSFPLNDRGEKLNGEVVISAELAQQEAARRGHPVETELVLYVIHGLLHLCGYDDSTAGEAARMRQRERHYLGQLGLPDIAPEDEC